MSTQKERIAAAVQWLLENPTEKATTSSRIHGVNNPHSVRVALQRAKSRGTRKAIAGGHNRVLSATQAEAIRLYCNEQYEAGLGATKQMVFAAICYLLQHQDPPRKVPSWRWFQGWLQKNPCIHELKTKPISTQRVDTHNEKDLEDWFIRIKQVRGVWAAEFGWFGRCFTQPEHHAKF
jgi:hypothetical protein